MTVQSPAATREPDASAAAHTRPRRRLGTVKRVIAEYLELPRSTAYDGFASGRIPGAVRVGKRVLVDLDALERWIDAGGTPLEPRS